MIIFFFTTEAGIDCEDDEAALKVTAKDSSNLANFAHAVIIVSVSNLYDPEKVDAATLADHSLC